MKKIMVAFLFVAILLIGSFSTFSKDKEIASQWISSPLKIDGSAVEWEEGPITSEKKYKVNCAFRNDSEFLYILFRFNDFKYLSSIQITGLTLWINTKGKNKKEYGINFGRRNLSANEYIDMLEKQHGPLSDSQKKELLSKSSFVIPEIKVINKKAKGSASAPIIDGKSAHYMVLAQKNTLTFEMAVPLARPGKSAPGIGVNPGEHVKLGFNWGGVTDKMKQDWMRGKGTGGRENVRRMSDSKGGSVAGADFSGGRGSSLTALKKRFKHYTFWVDLQLAQK